MLELRRAIEADQRMYVQWAEEKLSLATIAVDLVVQHRAILDTDIGALLAELKARRGQLWNLSFETALAAYVLLLSSNDACAMMFQVLAV